MKIESKVLIDDLMARSEKSLERAEALKKQDYKMLNRKASSESWSALECIEHLNLYGDFYLPEISKRIEQSKYTATKGEYFKSGLLGNYFANMMLPGEKMKKMKTFKDKNPAGSLLQTDTIDRFIQQQKELLKLLENARQINLNKTKTAISITSLLKLKLGDTFRVVIYHNQRHLMQAERAVNQ
ncbi:MAG: DinB family protein [Chitinophagales bacterium]